MNQLKIVLIGLIALWCICGLATGESQEQICVPLGSVPYEPSQPEAPVDCSKRGYHIDYSNRTRFYECYDNIRYRFECQTGLLFDLVNKRCEWPSNLECNPLEKTCPNGSVPVVPAQPSDCSKSDRSYYNDPSDPTCFHICYDGLRFDFKCHSGLYFDSRNKRCEWPIKMKCYDYIPISN